MCDISIIVPVYNVEAYLHECLDSILGQTFVDFEVICVDDSSRDSSLKVLNEYAGKDRRVKVIRNSYNMGLSCVRNIGLNQANGKYILFLDSDDFLARSALERMYSVAEEMGAEVLSFSSQTIYEVPETDINRYSGIRNHLYTGKMSGVACYLKQVEKAEYKCTVWQYLYRRDFLMQYDLRFPEGIYHEDLLFSFFVHMCAEKMTIINDILHYYRVRSDSLKTNGNIIKSVFGLFYGYMKSLQYSMTVLSGDAERNCAVEEHLMSMKAFVINFFYRCDSEQKKEFLNGLSDIQKHIFYLLTGYGKGEKINLSNAETDFLKSRHKLYVYGAGKYAQRMIVQLNQKGIQILGVLVTKLDGTLDSVLGYKVYKYSDMKEQLEGAVVIPGVSEKYLTEIMDILHRNQAIRIFHCSQL